MQEAAKGQRLQSTRPKEDRVRPRKTKGRNAPLAWFFRLVCAVFFCFRRFFFCFFEKGRPSAISATT